MFKQCKKILGALIVASALLPVTACVAAAQSGIRSYDLGHYQHAKDVLSQENPTFLTEFQALREEIKLTDSSNTRAQYEALMRFFPSIEALANMEVEPNEDSWTLQTEVVVTFFRIHLSTADHSYTDVSQLLFEAFAQYTAGGDAIEVLPEEEIAKQHNMSRKEAQRVRNVLRKLHGWQ